jgi:hypothetical protein
MKIKVRFIVAFDIKSRPTQVSLYSDSLRDGRSGNRIPVRPGFFTPVQTGTGAHPASCTMGTRSFLGVKQPGRVVYHPPPPSVEVTERVELYLYSPLGLPGLLQGDLYLYLYRFIFTFYSTST